MKINIKNPFLLWYISNKYLKYHEKQLNKVERKIDKWMTALNRGDKKIACIFDIDEVILCNIHENSYNYNGRKFNVGKDFFENYDPRFEPLLPGAKSLLEKVKSHNIEIFLLTGRCENIRELTIQNLEHVGLSGKNTIFDSHKLAPRNQQLIMRAHVDVPPRRFKEEQRKKITQKYHILFNIGDQPSDLGDNCGYQIWVKHPFYFVED